MMRFLSLAFVLTLLAAALVTAQRERATATVSASPVLYLVADSERDLATLPARFTRMTDATEIRYGDQLASGYLAGRPELKNEDARVETYVASVGQQIAARAHRKLPYRFHYVPDREFVNAFAGPGGHVFIGAGLLTRMTTEDELAAVLAHEIEHVDHYHCAERLQVEAAVRKIPLGELLEMPMAVFQAGYSKQQELEADREGVLLASHAGYSAAGAVHVFEMLARLGGGKHEAARTPQGEAAQVAADLLTGYFRSHPFAAERIAAVRALIAERPQLASPRERPLRERIGGPPARHDVD